MPVNYDAIKRENCQKYGTEIGRIGRMLLSDRYDDRTHFIYEILQNAEDALKKRGDWTGQRVVQFALDSKGLTVSHSGKPFDEADVRGVCGIGESTKELTDIGRFGIGFKSVYAYTDMPEIHSGREHFAIDNYVWPEATKKKGISPEETQIYIPFRGKEPAAKDEVLSGLQRLGPRTLLFLREIEEISWFVEGKPSGQYRRHNVDAPCENARRVRIVGQSNAEDDVTEEWLVFSRDVFNEGQSAGYVEVAFALDEKDENSSVKEVEDSELVVFFPTILPTHLGVLVQGPYRTTPSRDNVPERDSWNQHLVQETATLLVDALKDLRDLSLLSVSALRCLPLSAILFSERSRFGPLFQAVKETLLTESLLPAHNGKYTSGQNAKLARTQALRELIGPQRLSSLFPSDGRISWVNDEITQDREPILHRYLTDQLGIDEITPERLIPLLTKEFLEAQPDSWIKRLYEFFHGQNALFPRLRRSSLVRLEDGSHTVFSVGQYLQAYLPGKTPTDFPTVKRATCNSKKSREFLESLGLRTPDPVDDVIAHILPRYAENLVDIGSRRYPNDIERILSAFSSDSREQRARLVKALNEVKFIASVDMGSGEKRFARPGDTYMATERLRTLFKDVPDVLMVDNSRRCLSGENARDFLRAVETPEYLMPRRVEPSLTRDEKRELRRKEGNTEITREVSVEDRTLMGLDSLLKVIVALPLDEATEQAGLLWRALHDVQIRRGNSAFVGTYQWFRFANRSASFDAQFVHTLRNFSWVPDKDGVLKPPSSVVFQDTGWEPDPALAAKILFKPAVIDELAKLLCIRPEIIDNMGKLDPVQQDQVAQLIKSLIAKNENSDIPPTDPRPKPNNLDPKIIGPEVRPDPVPSPPTDRPSSPREFFTYVKVAPAVPAEDPDTLSHQERMDLERKAIDFIRSKEPNLQETPTGNPGFDLFETGHNGHANRWIEVKAMRGTFDNRPATLSKTQFEFAQVKQDACWLYVVENAGDPAQSRIVKIQDPAGKAQTFTFDRGWVQVAE